MLMSWQSPFLLLLWSHKMQIERKQITSNIAPGGQNLRGTYTYTKRAWTGFMLLEDQGVHQDSFENSHTYGIKIVDLRRYS